MSEEMLSKVMSPTTDQQMSPSDGSRNIYAHIDLNHTRDLDTRKSVIASAIFGNGTLLSWTSKKQPTVATLSMKAADKALCFGI